MESLHPRRTLRPTLAALILIAIAAPAAAQQQSPAAGGIVYGLVGGGFGDGTFVAAGAGAGLRLTRHLGLDLELTRLSGGRAETLPGLGWIASAGATSVFRDAFEPGATFEPDADFEDYPFPFIDFEDPRRDVTAFLTKFTVEFPIVDGLLFPYLTGGAGVGRVTERFGAVILPRIFPPPPNAWSDLGLSFTLGGGVDVRLWRGLGAGVDVRWLRVLRVYDAVDAAQLTARASYRF